MSRLAQVRLSLSVKTLLTLQQIELLAVLQPFIFTPPEENKHTHAKYQFPPAIVGLPAIYRKIPFLFQSDGTDQTVILALLHSGIKQLNPLKREAASDVHQHFLNPADNLPAAVLDSERSTRQGTVKGREASREE